MKTIYTTIIALVISISSFCQAPSTFKYQAVIRDANGQIMANTDVHLVFTILPSAGSQVYSETQNVTTNEFGLVSLEIGAGEGANSFSAIDWSLGGYSLKVDLDETEISNNTILSVPYSLYATNAKHAESVSDIGLSYFTNDAGYLKSEVDGDASNELQELSISGNEISISKGNSITIPEDENTTYSAGSGISLTGTTFSNSSPNATHTGDVTGSSALTIANDAITSAKIDDGAIVAADLNSMGASSGDVLKYSGTTWFPTEENISEKHTGTNLSVGLTYELFKIKQGETWLITANIPLYSGPGNGSWGAWLVYAYRNIYSTTTAPVTLKIIELSTTYCTLSQATTSTTTERGIMLNLSSTYASGYTGTYSAVRLY